MPVNRRLAAVVMADVVGYSRLMERDEGGTHERLRALDEELIAPRVAGHGGRIVKTAGDGTLLEFPSATSALRCAVEIQRELGARNLYVKPDERIELRIGINLGDVIVDGSDILGDGVNVAARLEALAAPGGICVASAVWEQVHDDLGVEFIDAGEQHVKNISKPVHVYRVALGHGLQAAQAASPAAGALTPRHKLARLLAAAGAAVVLGAGIVAGWRLMHDRADAATHAATRPLRSVMIRPFVTAADDAGLASAARQLTVDVTRALGDSMRHVRVVSPDPARAVAGKSVDAELIGREAEVRFLVEGELRPAGTQVAATLRLVDTLDGRQVEHDRRLIERAQLTEAEGVRQLTSAMRVMVSEAIVRSLTTQGTAAASAQDLVDRAMSVSIPDRVANAREVRRLVDAAIKLDPTVARAWAARATTSVRLYYHDFSASTGPLLADADADSMRAITLDPRDVEGWLARSDALHIRGNFDAAFVANDRAQELDPTRLGVLVARGYMYVDAGKPEETLKIATKLRPLLGAGDPDLAMQSCIAHVQLGEYAEAISQCERAENAGDPWDRHAMLAAAYAMHGDAAKAAQSRDRLLKVVPKFTVAGYQARFHPTFAPEAVAMENATFVPGLRKAGLPER